MKKMCWIGMFFLLMGTGLMAQTNVIAHRGFWDCEGSAQNSITAFEKAAEENLFGSELDVLITADGIPVVNHDDNIQGFVIENSTYDQLKDLKLKNGESLPTLEQYLKVGKQHPNTKLIIEIKPHKRVVNEDRAAAVILCLVDKYKLQNQVEYISFSMNICKEVIRRDPAALVYYLNGEVSPADLKALGFHGVDYHFSKYEQNPGWIEEARSLGMAVNVWTVNDEALMKSFIDQKVDYITTDKPLLLKEVLSK